MSVMFHAQEARRRFIKTACQLYYDLLAALPLWCDVNSLRVQAVGQYACFSSCNERKYPSQTLPKGVEVARVWRQHPLVRPGGPPLVRSNPTPAYSSPFSPCASRRRRCDGRCEAAGFSGRGGQVLNPGWRGCSLTSGAWESRAFTSELGRRLASPREVAGSARDWRVLGKQGTSAAG
jgi:hypothetical protein